MPHGPMNDVIAQVLADGSAPRTQDDVHALFDELEIPYTIVPHAPMFTVEEPKAHRGGAGRVSHQESVLA